MSCIIILHKLGHRPSYRDPDLTWEVDMVVKKEGGMPVSEALRLDELVQYGDGAVVSRTLVQRGVGTVTVFAFDQGQGLSEHSTPFDALVQILEGKAIITIGGEPIEVSAGESLLMPADIPHALDAPERYKMLLTMIREKKQ
jgi:quercetin dioxygenase-like cupin family protein